MQSQNANKHPELHDDVIEVTLSYELKVQNITMLHMMENNELQRRIDVLESENMQLKDAILHLWENEIVRQNNVRHIRKIHQETRDKWIYYHNHKDLLIKEYCTSHGLKKEQVSWVCIKKESDRLWNISRNEGKS